MNLHITKSKNAESFYICKSYTKANGSTTSAVSYTHLDVYKRQTQLPMRKFNSYLPYVPPVSEVHSFLDTLPTLKQKAMAVSYTHLTRGVIEITVSAKRMTHCTRSVHVQYTFTTISVFV